MIFTFHFLSNEEWSNPGGPWVTWLVKRPTLAFDSGHDPSVEKQNGMSGLALSAELILSLFPLPACAHGRALSLQDK